MIDQSLEPPDVLLGRLDAVVDERPRVGVHTFPRGAERLLELGELLLEVGLAVLEEADPHLLRQVPEEGEARLEAVGVVHGAVLELLEEERLALRGDLVDLARALVRPAAGACAVGDGLAHGAAFGVELLAGALLDHPASPSRFRHGYREPYETA